MNVTKNKMIPLGFLETDNIRGGFNYSIPDGIPLNIRVYTMNIPTKDYLRASIHDLRQAKGKQFLRQLRARNDDKAKISSNQASMPSPDAPFGSCALWSL